MDLSTFDEPLRSGLDTMGILEHDPDYQVCQQQDPCVIFGENFPKIFKNLLMTDPHDLDYQVWQRPNLSVNLGESRPRFPKNLQIFASD